MTSVFQVRAGHRTGSLLGHALFNIGFCSGESAQGAGFKKPQSLAEKCHSFDLKSRQRIGLDLVVLSSNTDSRAQVRVF